MTSLFGSPKAPAIPAPVVMPTENAAAVAQAQQQQAAQASAQSGRASTILMQNIAGATDKMGA